MLTLALETSTNQGGVAVTKNGRLLSRSIWTRGKSHSEALTAAIEHVLREANVAATSLDQIAVGIGPGSFTGIRIAVNAARTLSYGLAKPLRAFDTLEILAEGARLQMGQAAPNPLILVLVNAHKNLMYASRFRIEGARLDRLSDIEALSLEQVSVLIKAQPCIGVGDGCVEWDSLWPSSVRSKLLRLPELSDEPLPEILAHLAETSAKPSMSWRELQPLYIRPSEPEEKLRAGLLKDRSKINE